MADKKLVEQITSREEDFAQWYTDVVKKAELTDYSSVKGFMVIRPAGYAIWENIMAALDSRFKATDVQNCSMPYHIITIQYFMYMIPKNGKSNLNSRLKVR